MIITRKWLEKYLDLSDISNKQISVALNSLGFEVEKEINYEEINAKNKIVLGLIESVEQIPQTNLKSVKTKISTNKSITILTKASNTNVGDFVVVALPGSKLLNGIELQYREMQSRISEGMFCGYNEIAFSNNVLSDVEQSEILTITANDKNLHNYLGKNINQILGLDDYAFDVDLTLNRSDALAAYQLVKEVANYFNLSINKTIKEFKFSKLTQEFNFDINDKIIDKINTLSYSLIHLNEKKLKLNSVDNTWLRMCKVKSNANEFEDLANIATLISGQPFILLDADKITNDFEIKKTVIDKKDIYVLTNQKKVVNVIGKKVEKNFAVSEETQRILVIMLNIDIIEMRNQLKNLNTSNIDLQRYSKPLNPNLYDQGLKTLLDVINDYDILDFAEAIKVVIQKIDKENTYKTTLFRICNILGTEFTYSQIANLFKTLDIKVTSKKDQIIFEIDPNRTDVYGEFDLCEEVARIYGYDNFLEEPLNLKLFTKKQNLAKKLKNKTSDYLIGLGFNNIKNYSLVEKESNKNWNLFNIKNIVNVMSPLSKQRESYRTNLSKSMIETIIFNANNGNKEVSLFEFGEIFALNDFRQNNLCFATSNTFLKDPLLKVDIKASFLQIKSILNSILDFYKVDKNLITFQKKDKVIGEIHPFVNAEIKFKNKLLGFIFKLNPSFEKDNKIGETFVCELNTDILFEIANKNNSIKEIPKFQKSYRDVSLEIPNEISYQSLIKQMFKEIDYLMSYEVIDNYTSEDMKRKNNYSLTIKFEFNNIEKQLTDKDINEQFAKIVNNLKELRIKIR